MQIDGLLQLLIGKTGTSAQADLHKAVYNFYCYQCHAYAGDARTLASTFLDPKPRNFTATDPQQLRRGQMVDAITHGRAGTAMVSFSDVLDGQEIEAVVDFIVANSCRASGRHSSTTRRRMAGKITSATPLRFHSRPVNCHWTPRGKN